MTSKNIITCFPNSITDINGFIQTIIPQGAYDLKPLNNEIKRITLEEDLFTEVDYPITIRPNFPTLGYIAEISKKTKN